MGIWLEIIYIIIKKINDFIGNFGNFSERCDLARNASLQAKFTAVTKACRRTGTTAVISRIFRLIGGFALETGVYDMFTVSLSS
jgi:hypothetical protein